MSDIETDVQETVTEFLEKYRGSPDSFGRVTVSIRPTAGERAVVILVATVCDCDSPTCISRGALDLCDHVITARFEEKAKRALAKKDEESGERWEN